MNGSCQSASEAIKQLRAAGLKVSVSTQINRLSIDKLAEVLETVAALGIHGWQLQLTTHGARGGRARGATATLRSAPALSYPLLGGV